MNSNKVLIPLFSLLFLTVVALGVYLHVVTKDLRTQAVQLVETQNNLTSAKEMLARKDVEIDQILNKQAEQISILDESISPADKRWAKVKKVRKAVVDVIKQEGYHNVPDINGLTAYASSVIDYSEQYDVPVPLILAITTQESAFNVHAVSHAGAQGLMQLMPETAKECGNDINKPFYNVFKIRDNVQLGTWYLWKMLEVFNNDVALAVRAYNAGPTYVKKVIAGELPNYPKETIDYHESVLKWKKTYENLGL